MFKMVVIIPNKNVAFCISSTNVLRAGVNVTTEFDLTKTTATFYASNAVNDDIILTIAKALDQHGGEYTIKEFINE